MLYEEYETKTSHDNLSRVVSTVPEPACLIGGWAVYYTVNTNYRANTGMSYQGSKDIDLGFHIDENATAESLHETSLAKASRSLEEMGFRGMGGRLFQEYHRETHLPLSEAKAKKTPTYNLFQLYVDLLVDNAPKDIKKAVGFIPFDEKLLLHVFRDKMFKMIDEFPAKVILPLPQVLLAMKMISLPGRTKDHKKHKDIMDVYALIWHSGIPIRRLRSDLIRLISSDDMHRALSAIDSSDYEQAAHPLGLDPKRLKTVISNFVRGIPVVRHDGGGWPLPKNMSYGKLVLTAKALLQKGAAEAPVSLEALSGAVGLSNTTMKMGLSFLESIGITTLTTDNRYILTADGALYAKAHLNSDVDQIRSLTLNAIKQSHLVDLADAIAINDSITKDELYKRIKMFGKYPDGKGAGGMHSPVTVGARAVLLLFEDAGLLKKDNLASAAGRSGDAAKALRGALGRPDGLSGATAVNAVEEHGPRRSRGTSGKTVQSGKRDPPPVDDGIDDLAVLTVKGVGQVRVNDQETLGMAEIYMDMLRKRVSGDSGT